MASHLVVWRQVQGEGHRRVLESPGVTGRSTPSTVSRSGVFLIDTRRVMRPAFALYPWRTHYLTWADGKHVRRRP